MRKFQRRIEDFVCEHCGAEVKGNGYTNHCPRCLHSKHVDINPGDRLAVCGGLMAPIDIIMEKGQYVLIQRCQKCGLVKKNKTAKNDNLETLFQKPISS